MENISVGERILKLRLAHNNMTREKLAELADISTSFLYEIETGKKGFSADVLERLAGALDVKADYILHGTENMAKEESAATGEKLSVASLIQVRQLLSDALKEIKDLLDTCT